MLCRPIKRLFSLIIFLNLSVMSLICADDPLPFCSFSNATLSVATGVVYSKDSNTVCQLLSGCAPRPPSRPVRYSSRASMETIEGDILVIADDCVGLVSHYFHFMEHLIGIWNFLTYEKSENVRLIVFAFKERSDNDHTWMGSTQITQILLSSLFPNATVQLFSDLPSNSIFQADHIHVSSRLRSHKIPSCSYTNMNGSAYLQYEPQRLRQMRDYVLDALGISVESPLDTLRITYCKRSVGRTIQKDVEIALLEALSQEPGCSLQVVDFATISFPEQLAVIANTDFFLGPHGNGLTHLVFLPDDGSILEYYEGGESALFRIFAQCRGLRYYGNSHSRWVTQEYHSIDNLQPFQASISRIDLETTLQIVRSSAKELVEKSVLAPTYARSSLNVSDFHG